MRRGAFRLVPILAAIAILAGIRPLAADPVATAAQHAYIVDTTTGAVLFDKGGNESIHPASMSKLMTIYMLFDALRRGEVKLTDTFHVSQKAWSMQGSKMFVDIDTDVAIEDLIRGIVVQSGNDACIVVAEGLAGSEEEFAQRMNAKAKELGLTGSHFVNASGWPDPEHLMTAHDLAILAWHLIAEFPEHYHYFSETEFTYHGIKQGNRNPLLYREGSGVDGLKTGHTEEAGFGLTASAKRGERRLVMVVQGLTGMQERADEAGNLLDWAFRNFENYKLPKGVELVQAPVWLGAAESVPLTIGKDAPDYITLPRSALAGIQAKAVFAGPIPAPVQSGTIVGKLIVTAPDLPPIELPLAVLSGTPELGFFPRIGKVLANFIAGSPDAVPAPMTP